MPSATSTPLAEAQALADAIDGLDEGLRAHSEEVSRLAGAVAPLLGVEGERQERLVAASLLHDVGKLALGEEILLKPGPLTPRERAAVEEHPRIGARLVAGRPELRPVVPAILHHHERWDGTGYPAGLRAREIPLEARIIGVVDAFAAMLSERPYSAAVSADEACDELERCAGTQFDPLVVEVFVETVRGER